MIKFEHISKKFKGNVILKDLSFEIESGKLVAIIGASGCGKTTTLKMINRLIKPSSGTISIDGINIEQTDEIELRRKIGYVIQQTGLFPHMTIRENIELIPKVEKLEKEKIAQNTIRLMKMVGLDPDAYLDRYPTELSGGQQQRIGVARAFANDPDIILMDEPFSALDPITRSDLQEELINLQAKMNKTIVFVTHDMSEAIKIADMICIMKDGEIVQYDTPENILKNPINDFVSNFVGKDRIWSSPEYIKVSDIMIEKPITCTKELSIIRCMEKMRSNKVDSLLVIDSITRKLEGIIKAKELRNVEDKTQSVGNVMRTTFFKLHPDQTIIDALSIVNENHISTVPVVDDDGALKGLVTNSSLVTTLSQQYIDMEE
ncbi:ABC transporter ATP-binding protein [Clostridium sp. Marseille-P299]|uniref:ABC transporter ATP-binding protein n=1 Tax=Clostridium sp. Marseille-P299 TaxID=1805477 RepID=UPI0008339E42|nr:ABC transporter ATP-binding protein [Clostridium sp. Marseille-P299]